MLNKVFVVDDDPGVRTIVKHLLEDIGLEVEEFENGQAFIDAYQGELGVLLIDLRMPLLSGHQVHQQLLEKGYKIPVVFLSGHGDIDMAVLALKNGAADFITKPFNNQYVIDTVQLLLHKEESQALLTQKKMLFLSKVDRLTHREKEILGEMVKAKKTKQIAVFLSISPNTVEVHRTQIMKKLEVSSLVQLIGLVVRYDVFDIEIT